MLFSQRVGITPIKIDLQREQIDTDLKISIWNAYYSIFTESRSSGILFYSAHKILFHSIWINFFKRPIDRIPYKTEDYHEFVRNWFFSTKTKWYELLDFIEFVVKNAVYESEVFKECCNESLEKEVSAYRIIDREVAEITDLNEISAIEQALENTKGRFEGVHLHLKSALEKMSNKKNPDYRNSIKESISAVEALAKLISEEPKVELGKALKKLNEKLNLHKALIQGFLSLYGYTSDADGIRHAMLEESTVYYEDAKYMLVSCSAFTNYLIVKIERAK